MRVSTGGFLRSFRHVGRLPLISMTSEGEMVEIIPPFIRGGERQIRRRAITFSSVSGGLRMRGHSCQHGGAHAYANTMQSERTPGIG